MELFYRLWSAENEEIHKVLFLHGMGGTGQIWRSIAASLEKDMSLLAPDQRGHGESQFPSADAGLRNRPTFTPLDYGRDVAELIEKLRFYPTWVVGHSMGVRTACAIAHLRPELVKGLVLVDLGLSGVAGGGLGEGLASFLKKLPTDFPSRAEAREFMEKECPDPSIAQYLMAVSLPTPTGGVRFPFDHGALIETIYAARDVSVRTWLKALAQNGMPILILRGGKSLVWSREEFLEEKEAFASFPSVIFEEVDGASHGLPFEKRLEFVDRLRTFFHSNSSRP